MPSREPPKPLGALIPGQPSRPGVLHPRQATCDTALVSGMLAGGYVDLGRWILTASPIGKALRWHLLITCASGVAALRLLDAAETDKSAATCAVPTSRVSSPDPCGCVTCLEPAIVRLIAARSVVGL